MEILLLIGLIVVGYALCAWLYNSNLHD